MTGEYMKDTVGKVPMRPPATVCVRRQYRAPVLQVFGKVAELTQGTTGSCMADGVGCVAGTMGMSTSDRRTKEQILRVGDHPLGIGLYLFHYKPEFRDEWGHGRQFGVMADEVESVMPAAVCWHSDGYRMVDYSMLGISRFEQ